MLWVICDIQIDVVYCVRLFCREDREVNIFVTEKDPDMFVREVIFQFFPVLKLFMFPLIMFLVQDLCLELCYV